MQEEINAKLSQFQEQINKLNEKITSLENSRKDQLSIALVSGDLDKILAAMVIALSAAAQDTRVKLLLLLNRCSGKLLNWESKLLFAKCQ
jgi:restriction endonuclease S subunit